MGVERRLANTVAMWLADDRPAWETIEAFERDVERIMRGELLRPAELLPPPSSADHNADVDILRRRLIAAYRVPPHDLRPIVMEDGWSSVRHTSQGTVYRT